MERGMNRKSQRKPELTAYQQKLLDPRWQKKRLAILERDEWTCQKCFDSETTLHVHHRYYAKGKDPWDYHDALLVTLCAECHEYESNMRHKEEYLLLNILRHKGFYAEDIHGLARALSCLDFDPKFDMSMMGLEWAIRNDSALFSLAEAYREWSKHHHHDGALDAYHHQRETHSEQLYQEYGIDKE